MNREKILKVIDEFFDKKQKEIKDHVKQFGKYGNRDIDPREKSVMLTLPIGYRKKLKELFALREKAEVKK